MDRISRSRPSGLRSGCALPAPGRTRPAPAEALRCPESPDNLHPDGTTAVPGPDPRCPGAGNRAFRPFPTLGLRPRRGNGRCCTSEWKWGYLPLYIFCGRHLLAARLRRADIDASKGSVEEVGRIVTQIRSRWPNVSIVLRADSGFARDALMDWCGINKVDYIFGLARNQRLEKRLAPALEEARLACRASGEPARVFDGFMWSAKDSWSRPRRVIGKAEWTLKGSNPRFIVTSLKPESWKAKELYEDQYCARGDMENRIKECQLDLYADCTSAHTMRANQLRLWFASFAYVLLCALRRIGLANTTLAEATCGTIRLKLLKIGALIRISVRRIKIAMASACPQAQEFALAHARICAAAR